MIHSQLICDSCGSTEYEVLRASKLNVVEDEKTYFSSSSKPIHSQLVRCRCQLVFIYPRPPMEKVNEEYKSAIDMNHATERGNRIKSFKRVFRQNTLMQYLVENAHCSLLDIGSASGEFVECAAQLGIQAQGIEPSIHLSSIARTKYGLNVATGFLDTSNYPSSHFNIVSMMDVLEHLESPSTMLNDISKILDSNGILILNLPMIDTFTARLMRFKWPFFLEVHLYYFTKKSIESLLKNNGFKIVQTSRYSQSLSIGYLLNRVFGKDFPKFLGLIPFRYCMGQRTIIAKKA
jgi:SAM-dependent methyltransferase